MRKRNFAASSWLQRSAIDKTLLSIKTKTEQPSILPSFEGMNATENPSTKFPVMNLDLDWLSENLNSKSGYLFTQALNDLSKEVIFYISNNKNLLHILKDSLFNEFLDYCDQHALSLTLNDSDDFLLHLKEIKQSEHSAALTKFLNFYACKVSSFYLLKLRLLRIISIQEKETIIPSELLSINSLFLKYFKKNSSIEFKSTFLRSNLYSWFSPSVKVSKAISQYFNLCEKLSLHEILNILNSKLGYQKLDSQALGHKNFGLLFNSILINFTDWLDNKKLGKTSNELNILSTKFKGEKLEELSHAFWQAQYNNSYFKWDDLLCPKFERMQKDDFFFKLINEIEFYSFLVKISPFYSMSSKQFLSKCASDYNFNTQEDFSSQKSFVFEDTLGLKTTYNRILLSVIEQPKKNPWYYLSSKIKDNVKDLKDQGYMVVLSNQSLFVPSQKEKLKLLLNDINIECVFNFCEVKGKGEIPNYIYVISKKKIMDKHVKRRVCYNFRFNSDLSSMVSFSALTKEMNQFLESNFEVVPPFHQKVGNGYTFQFFQNTIINGQIIQNDDDESRITHPSFMNNMIKSCKPFHHYFHLSSLDLNDSYEENYQTDFNLSSSFSLIPQSEEYVLIYNFNKEEEIFVEIISKDLLHSKIERYGKARCYYYYLVPKVSNLNINLYQDYFRSTLGKQLTQASIIGSYHKAKSKVENVLIPECLSDTLFEDIELENLLDFMVTSEEQLLNNCSTKLLNRYKQAKTFFDLFLKSNKGPGVLSYLSYFRKTLLNIETNLSILESDVSKFDFSNPLLKEKLLGFKLSSLYPNNDQVFISFFGENHKDVFKTFTRSSISFDTDDEKSKIDIYSDDCLVISIHCEKFLGVFINFCLKNVKNIQISDLIKSLKVPDNEDLKDLTCQFLNKKNDFKELSKDVEILMNSIFRKLVSKQS